MSDLKINQSTSGSPLAPIESGSDSVINAGITTPPLSKDTLATSDSSTSNKKGAASDAPTLQTPKSAYPSLMDFLSAIGDTRLKFSQNLREMEMLSLQMSNQMTQMIAEQVAILDEINGQIDEAPKTADAQAKGVVQGLQTQVDQAKSLVDPLNDALDKMQSQNESDKTEAKKVVSAYDSYSKKMEELKVKETSPGVYEAPTDPKALETYNGAVKDYQTATSAFNTYLDGRQKEIQAYNDAATAYNSQVETFNESIKAAGLQYGFDYTPYLLPTAPLSDISAYHPLPTDPVAAPPDYIKELGDKGAPIFKPLAYQPPDPQKEYNSIYNAIYTPLINNLNQQLTAQINYLNTLRLQSSVSKDQLDAFIEKLHSQPSSQRLLPSQSVYTDLRPERIKNLSSIGMLEAALQSQSALSQSAIEAFFKNNSQESNEKDRQAALRNLLLLTLEHSSAQAIASVIPTLKSLGSAAGKIQDNPSLLPLLTAFTYLKRIQTENQLNWGASGVAHLASFQPVLNKLSDGQKDALGDLLQAAELLAAGHLIEANSGQTFLKPLLKGEGNWQKGLETKILSSLIPALGKGAAEAVTQELVNQLSTLPTSLQALANKLGEGSLEQLTENAIDPTVDKKLLMAILNQPAELTGQILQKGSNEGNFINRMISS